MRKMKLSGPRLPSRRNFLRAAGTGTAATAAAVAVGQSPAAAAVDHGTVMLVAAKNAPARVKNAAWRVCDGVRDQVQINQCIDLLRNQGGVVQLSEGTFNLTGPVQMRKRITLQGHGRATVLRAKNSWTAYDGTLGAVIEPRDGGVSKTRVSNLTINGNRQNIKGIYYNITNTANFDETPDAKHIFTDLYIMKCGSAGDTGAHGFHMDGSENRGNQIRLIRVWDPKGHGYLISAPDSYYSQCEVGSSGLTGFRVETANCHFNQCKAWYSEGDGWEITSWRNIFTSCESQDNRGHGFRVNAGPNSFTGCLADSNAYIRNQPAADKDGFHILGSYNILSGCMAFDKNEGGRGVRQRYGYYLGGGAKYTQIQGNTRVNRVGNLGGSGVTSPDNLISVLGGI